MSNFKQLSLTLLLFITSSCAFNSRFHFPVKINPSIEELRLFIYGKDTSLFSYNEKTKLVNITDNKGQSKHEDFSIEAFEFSSTSGNALHGWLLSPKDITPLQPSFIFMEAREIF